MKPMDTAAWSAIERVFAQALEQPPSERARFLDEVRKDDPATADKVAALLAAEEQAGSLLENAVAGAATGLLADASDLPDRIGPYRFLRRLGAGGMGDVYLVERADGAFDQRLALKIVRRGMDSEAVLARFRAERQILAQLEHPGIARIVDGGLTPTGLPWFAMEYVDGEPIDRYCDRHNLSIEARLHVFLTACDAVAYAHGRLIVHRDIKPDNILVTADGQAKLVDFGIAKVLADPELAEPKQPQTVLVAMTPEYASPEQVLGQPVTTGTDVYALGVVLYRLLTGRRPYAADTKSRVEMERAVCTLEPVRPSTAIVHPGGKDPTSPDAIAGARGTQPQRLRRRLSGDLDTIILKALQKQPDDRYHSVTQFAEDVRRHLDRLPVLARPASRWYRARRFVSRHRRGVAGTAAAVALLVALTTVFTARLASERDRARLETATAEQVVTFLQNLFELSDPMVSAEQLTARQLLDQGTANLDTALASQPDVQARILGVAGNVYRGLGVYGEAQRLLEESLQLERRLHGNEHPEVARALSDLGLTEGFGGDFDAGEAHQREALDLRLRLFGPSSLAVAESKTRLSFLVREKGDWDEAERLALEALPAHRADPAQDKQLVFALNNLGMIARRQGNLEQAERWYREAIDAADELLDPTYPDLVSVKHNLAIVLESRGELAGAEALKREVLEARRERLGAQHPGTLTALNNLAVLLWKLGRYAEAEASFREVVDISRVVLGDGHPSLAININNLAVALRRKGDYDAAEALQREALAMNRALLPETNPRIAADLQNLARILQGKGDLAAAEQMHREALATRRKLLGDRHPDVADGFSGLALTLRARGEYGEAEGLLREALAIQREVLGERSPKVAETTHDLAVVLADSGAAADAERLLRSALRMRREILGAEHPNTAATMRELGRVLRETGRYTEAEPLLLESYRVASARLAPSDRDIGRALDELVALYRAWERPAQAGEYEALLRSAG